MGSARSGTPGIEVVDLQLSFADAGIAEPLSAGMIAIEFTDYQCPFCGRFARETYPRIVKDLVTAGDN